MNKTIQILLVVSGIGVAIWLVSKFTARPQTVVVPTASTGTASAFEQFFPAFGRIPTNTLGLKSDSTAARINAASNIVKELPAVFKGFGDAWASWRTPSTKTATPSARVDTGFDSSYEEFYAGDGW